jgi:hypothetical protein
VGIFAFGGEGRRIRPSRDAVLEMVRGTQQAFGPKEEILSRLVRRESPAPGPLKIVGGYSRLGGAQTLTDRIQTVFTVRCHGSLAAVTHRRQPAPEPMRRFEHTQEFLQDVSRSGGLIE